MLLVILEVPVLASSGRRGSKSARTIYAMHRGQRPATDGRRDHERADSFRAGAGRLSSWLLRVY
jgi:hypothetical protein